MRKCLFLLLILVTASSCATTSWRDRDGKPITLQESQKCETECSDAKLQGIDLYRCTEACKQDMGYYRD